MPVKFPDPEHNVAGCGILSNDCNLAGLISMTGDFPSSWVDLTTSKDTMKEILAAWNTCGKHRIFTLQHTADDEENYFAVRRFDRAGDFTTELPPCGQRQRSTM